jgi:hypothetical protein
MIRVVVDSSPCQVVVDNNPYQVVVDNNPCQVVVDNSPCQVVVDNSPCQMVVDNIVVRVANNCDDLENDEWVVVDNSRRPLDMDLVDNGLVGRGKD